MNSPWNRRDFIKTSGIAALGTYVAGHSLTSSLSAATPSDPARFPWLQERGRFYFYDQYALNDQASAFSKYDPDRIVEELMATGADVIALYAANQFSVTYYPSKIWPEHPNLNGRDYFGDLTTRLRQRGKKIVAYINWLESRHADWNVHPVDTPVQVEMPLASWAKKDDPEWRVQNVPGGRWRYACTNSPRRDQILAVTREIVDRYQPEAFCLDMLHANGHICVCPYCRPTLEKMCGTKTLTKAVITKNWRAYIDWRHEQCASLLGELSQMLRDKGVLNAHNIGRPLEHHTIGVGEEWMEAQDALLLEGSWNMESPGLLNRAHRAYGKPTWQLLSSSVLRHSHLSQPLSMWRLNVASARANGAQLFGPCGVGAYPDTTTPKELLANTKIAFDEFMQDSDLGPTGKSIAKVGLVFSWRTRKYYKAGEFDWAQELLGWFRVLLDEHIPFDIVIAEKIKTADDLAQYDLLVLPNTVHLSDLFCRALTAHVESRGASVLAVGETSLGDERGYMRDEFALSSLLGITRQGTFEGRFAFETSHEPRPAMATLQKVRTSGRVLSRMISVDPDGPVAGQLDPLPMAPTEWPVTLTRAAGKGKVGYLAFPAGQQFITHHAEHFHRLMASMLDELMPNRQLTLKGPRCVEVTIYRQNDKKRTIVHLANRTQTPHDLKQVKEILPIHELELFIPGLPARSRVTARGTRAVASPSKGGLTIKINKLETYAAVVFEHA